MVANVAVIGAGITGLAAARLLRGRAKVTVFEAAPFPGGLIRCDRQPNGLFHRVGGHVFNTHSPRVADWFWSVFSREDFFSRKREARILTEDREIGYPIENHLDQLPASLRATVLRELAELAASGSPGAEAANFRDFLLGSFGPALCAYYFFPYNQKIWRRDLADIPLGWLDHKLPRPSPAAILRAHARHEAETEMVHATFHYAKRGGSQFIVDHLAEGLDLRADSPVLRLERDPRGAWLVNGDAREPFDAIIHTGDIRRFADLFPPAASHPATPRLRALRARGLCTVFCERAPTDSTWLYLPDPALAAHRVIHTGVLSPHNNYGPRLTCVVEFPPDVPDAVVDRDLARLPGDFRRLARHDVEAAYVIQEHDTRAQVAALKSWTSAQGLHLAGRFAEWEYYNLDLAIESAMRAIDALPLAPARP